MNRLCLGCMQVKYDTPICQHCGFDERTPNMPHQLPLGTVLQNRYVIGRVLGQGGFGITYIGWDKQTSSPVAIKEYFPGGVVQRYTTLSTTVSVINGDTQDVFAKHRNRFLTEAKTLSTLTGIPEIVQVKSWFPDNDTAYIVMEYVQGTTLKQHLRNLGRPMTEKEALDIMEPVLRALQKVHDHGLIHRDISPDNIMLPPSSGIKLIDFGTARYLDDSGKSKSTEAVLKPGFAPMEQYNTRGNIGPWTDVYALCATFHYLLTGKVAPDVHTRMEQGDALTMLRNRSNISKKLVQALEKGMKILPQNRIQSVAKLYAMLYAKPTVIPWKKLAAAGCAAVAAIAVAAVLLLMPEREAPEVPTQPVSGSAKEVTVPSTTALPTEETTEATTEPEETTEATEETTAPTQAPKYQPSYDEYYGDDDSYSPPPADSPAPAPTEAPAPPPTEAPAPPPTEAPAPPPPPATEAPAPAPTLPDLPSYEDPNYGYDWT